MDLRTADWSAVNAKDDLEAYNKMVRGGKKDDSSILESLKKARGMGDSGVGVGRGSGRTEGDGDRRKKVLPVQGSSKPPPRWF